MSALSDLVKYALMGDVVYMRGGQAKYYSRAKEASDELSRLRAVAEACHHALMVAMWELDYQDDGIIARCVGCAVERDDLESGIDKHADGCIIAHAFAALAAERGGEG